MNKKLAQAAIWIFALTSTTALAAPRPDTGPRNHNQPTQAQGHHPHHGHGSGHGAHANARPNLQLTNRFDGALQLFANGRLVGTIQGNQTIKLNLPSGWTDLQARRANTGAVLFNKRAALFQNNLEAFTIHAPQTTVRVANRGQEPLFVGIANEGSMWLSPGQVGNMRVKSGNVVVTGQANRNRHLKVVGTRTIFAEPGQINTKVIDLIPDPPARTMMTLKNNKNVPMFLTINGRSIGRIEPGRTKSFSVTKGWSNVTMHDRFGNVHYSNQLHFYKHQNTKVTLGTSTPSGVIVARL